jgi:hypothetical protein
MKQLCNTNLHKTLDLVKEMIILADEGEAACKDDGCVVLFGIIRDCAYRIKMEAEREMDVHLAHGTWNNNKQTFKGEKQ